MNLARWAELRKENVSTPNEADRKHCLSLQTSKAFTIFDPFKLVYGQRPQGLLDLVEEEEQRITPTPGKVMEPHTTKPNPN